MNLPENPRPRPGDLLPGTIIELDGPHQLDQFEDAIMPYVDFRLQYNQEYWEGREPLRDKLQVKNFYGSVRDITIQVMPEPYERLLDARERGWQMKATNLDKMSPAAAESCLGFIYSASAHSSGRGNVGRIQAEMWYVPVIQSSQYGRAVRRYVTNPKLEKAAFARPETAARRIGFTTLQSALRPPYLD